MKGILFKEDMFEAVINGSKNQTRRIIPEKDLAEGELMKDEKIQRLLCEGRARYKKGDVVYLKEPYDDSIVDEIFYRYLTTSTNKGFKNKLFMPAKHARYFIKITNVRVERLDSISIADARAEGIEIFKGTAKFTNYLDPENPIYSERKSFLSLWDSINAKPKAVSRKDKSGKSVIIYYVSYPSSSVFADHREEINGKPHYCHINPWLLAYDFELTDKPVA